MRTLKSSFVWQFAIGFAIGAVGLLTFEPSDARHTLAHHFLPAAHARR